MIGQFFFSPRSLLLAVSISMTLAACSDDDGGSGKPDGGKVDATTPGVEAGAPDMARADLPGMDSQMADAPGTKDAGIDASIDVSIIDAPMVDSGSVDGGQASLVARGKYLVDHVIACTDCHTPQLPSGAPDMTKYLAGNADFVKLPSGDVLPSRNLTPDPATGLGGYSAAQIKRMFMDGLRPADGGTAALNSIMPYYVFHNMTSADADAIVAYLQAIPAVVNPLPKRSAMFDVPAPSDYLDPATIPAPAATYPQRESAMRGRYLAAESGLCIECHTPHLQGGSKAIDTSKYFWGGEDYSAFFAGTLNIHPVSANLTSDPATGLGDWSAAEIATVLLQGKDDHGDGICPPMPAGPMGAYGGLTTQDAVDIANYIKSLPPAVNDVPDMCTWPPVAPVDGGSVDSAKTDSAKTDSAKTDSAAIDGSTSG